MKSRLREVAGRQSRKDALVEVEHLDNQLHIQLINIHDLKQAIKSHDRQIQSALITPKGDKPDKAATEHENLYDDYQQLEHTLQDLRSEFSEFVGRAR
ncbi:MAG: hypothetical protein P0Y53_17975 [Candidatus Pseudobacter hemicellulosilyticus]|uniref:Uncharacterized protein n=1 Tax=Candidatus Pseudobacter hemicellulosilyticus TaxID=3121375 RepID=A0AAJ5WRI1_9BACT|nr:MAG: hypothetical protein P0Y53_17975 [Pseudobacter sp.]